MITGGDHEPQEVQVVEIMSTKNELIERKNGRCLPLFSPASFSSYMSTPLSDKKTVEIEDTKFLSADLQVKIRGVLCKFCLQTGI